MWLRHLIVAAALASVTACASTGLTPHPFPQPESASPPRASSSEPAYRLDPSEGYAIVGTALALQGAPYRSGGADPAGFDCSGFVWYVFAQHGVILPRGVREQYRSGRPIEPESVEPGDLLFFTTAVGGATHVAIAIGGDQFVHAPSSRGHVRVERLASAYWGPKLIGARRVAAPINRSTTGSGAASAVRSLGSRGPMLALTNHSPGRERRELTGVEILFGVDPRL
jgi:hypothetical protein